MSRLVAALATLLAAGPAFAQARSTVLRGEFIVDLEPVPSSPGFPGLPDPTWKPSMPTGQAADSLMAEASWVFAGMLWGFDFVYTPYDRSRAVADLFELEPRGSFEGRVGGGRAGAGPVVASVRADGNSVLAVVEYAPSAVELAEMGSWYAADRRNAQGTGTAPAASIEATMPGVDGLALEAAARRAAVVNALREALRTYLRAIDWNKPREVRGSFAFSAPPRLFLKAGSWTAIVRIRVVVDSITPYGEY